jgi:hypothetical protein
VEKYLEARKHRQGLNKRLELIKENERILGEMDTRKLEG